MKMKNTILSVLFALTAFFLASGSLQAVQNAESPLDYNNRLIDIQNSVIKIFIEFSDSIKTIDQENLEKSFAQIESIYTRMKDVVNIAVNNIKKIKPYNKDDNFRKAMKNLLEFYKSIVAKEYREMINILEKAPNLSDEDIKRLDELQVSITNREAAFDEKLDKAQNAFAKKHNFKLKENEYQDAINK